MSLLTKKSLYKKKRRAVNRATKRARREAIGGHISKPRNPVR